MALIGIHGAGSIGCYLGGRLAAAGSEVLLVGRERLRRELADSGLRVSDYRGADLRLAASAVRYDTSPAALAEAMARRQQVSPETQILLQLAAEPDSWLARLRALHAACLLPVTLPDIATEDESPARIGIPVVMTEADAPLGEPDRAMLADILKALTQTIRDFRAELVEF